MSRSSTQSMTAEELAAQRKKLHRQVKNTLDLFNDDIKLHRMLKPIFVKLTHHGPETDHIDGEELGDILDSLPSVDLVCNGTTYSTLVIALVCFSKAVLIHGYPVPDSFLEKHRIPTAFVNNRHFHYNIWFANLLGARGPKLQKMIDLYAKHHRDIEANRDSELSNAEKFMKTPVRSEPLPREAPRTPAERPLP